MEQFIFKDDNLSVDGDGKRLLSIDSDENFHLTRVLRVKVGEKILATNGYGRTFKCVVKKIGKTSTVCEVLTEYRDLNASARSFCIGLSLLKPISKLELAVEKCTELGARGFVLFYTERTEKVNVRMERLRAIGLSAVKQSLQSRFPEIVLAETPEEVIQIGRDYSERFVLHEKSDRLIDRRLREVAADESAIALIGPEGGFTEKEISFFCQRGFASYSLGGSRLRSETAALKIASLLATY